MQLDPFTVRSILEAEIGVRRKNGSAARWQPGEPLRLFLVAYTGDCNTGADARVEALIQQLRHLLGPDQLRLSLLVGPTQFTLNAWERATYYPSAKLRGYFKDAEYVDSTRVMTRLHVAPLLSDAISAAHGAIACEGAMFKSIFSNFISVPMILAMGMANHQGKLSIAYGGEAGHMDRFLTMMAKHYCADSRIIARNKRSQELLCEMGMNAEFGTDTAWTFESASEAWAEKELRARGWDGKTPILAVCPVDRYVFPLHASMRKFLAKSVLKKHAGSHVTGLYFWSDTPMSDKAHHYANSLADAVKAYHREESVFPVVIAMDKMDSRICALLSERLDGAPIFNSLRYDMFQMVAILRKCDLLVSSRYHAVVLSMPGLVPSAGISFDERLVNVMAERGQEQLIVGFDDPDLASKLVDLFRQLRRDREKIQEGIARTVVQNVKTLASMGKIVADEVTRCYPEFQLPQGRTSWEHYLPPLPAHLVPLVERWG